MTDRKPQIHISMVDMLSKCGWQFLYRYGARFGIWEREEIMPPGVALVTGIAVHKSVERNLKNKVTTGQLLSIDECAQEAVDSVKQQWDAGMMLSEDEAMNPSRTLGETVDQAVRLSALHHSVVAPTISPAIVEESWVLEMPNYPYDLAGQIDCVEVDSALRDLKTAAKTPGENDADTIQSNMYAAVKKVTTKKYPTRIIYDFLVKNKVPKYECRIHIPTDESITKTRRRVGQLIALVDHVKETGDHELFTPADPGHWACTKKYCGYHSRCPFWSGK